MKNQNKTRRDFLKKSSAFAAGAMILPTIIPSNVFGKTAPSNLINIEMTTLYQRGKGNYNTYRIPSLIVTTKGTVLAFAEGREGEGDGGDIDMIVKRSTDNGKTWSKTAVVWNDEANTCGNPCPVIDQTTGRIVLVMSWGHGEMKDDNIINGKYQRHPYMCYSDDDGLTWSEPVNLVESCKRPEWGWYATGPGIGIQIKSGKYKNRLVIPANHSYLPKKKKDGVVDGKYAYGAHVLFSDDGGATWQISESLAPNFNESQVIELEDGRLMMNMRSFNGIYCRAISYSDDGGATWSEVEHDYQLVEDECQASIIKYGKYDGKQMYLFSNPANPHSRAYMTVKVSIDECKTWSNGKLVYGKCAAYSCLTLLPNGNIGLLFEGGKDYRYESINFVSFNPDELFKLGTMLADDCLP